MRATLGNAAPAMPIQREFAYDSSKTLEGLLFMIAHLKRLGGANVHDRGIVYVMRTGACHGQAVFCRIFICVWGVVLNDEPLTRFA